MTRVPIPDGVVGRVGMIAALRGVKPSELGKLVVVRHAVGLQPDPRDRNRTTFTWQVLGLGATIELNGKGCRELVVPDDCLRPVSQVEPGHVDALVKAQARHDVERAAADLGRYLEKHPMSGEDLDACLLRAVDVALIQRALEVVPVATVLAELGFRSDADSCAWRWSVIHGGAELTVLAGHDMFGRWSIVGTCSTSREAMWDERVLTGQESRGKVMAIVLDLWRTAFGKSASAPSTLTYAEQFEQHLRDMRKVDFGPPTLSVDGDMLRSIRKILASRYGLWRGEVGPPMDMRITLSFDGILLRLVVGDDAYGVRAAGVWIEDCQISLREFLAMPAQRLRGVLVEVERLHNALGFNTYYLAAERPIDEDSATPPRALS